MGEHVVGFVLAGIGVALLVLVAVVNARLRWRCPDDQSLMGWWESSCYGCGFSKNYLLRVSQPSE